MDLSAYYEDFQLTYNLAVFTFFFTVFVVIFGVIWTMITFAMTATGGFGIIGLLFPLFGICFVGFGIYDAYIAYQNAHGEDRMSLFDIVDGDEEPDPWSGCHP